MGIRSFSLFFSWLVWASCSRACGLYALEPMRNSTLCLARVCFPQHGFSRPLLLAESHVCIDRALNVPSGIAGTSSSRRFQSSRKSGPPLNRRPSPRSRSPVAHRGFIQPFLSSLPFSRLQSTPHCRWYRKHKRIIPFNASIHHIRVVAPLALPAVAIGINAIQRFQHDDRVPADHAHSQADFFVVGFALGGFV